MMPTLSRLLTLVAGIAALSPGLLRAAPLPAADSPAFCVAAQQFLASTTMVGKNTLFTDMPSYRHSKPLVDPLQIFQVVSYAGKLPVMVSCKVKTAAHLRAAHGAKAAGKQLYCPDVTRQVRAQAVAELRAANQAAAADKAAAFVIDENEPYTTGRSYLADFQLSYRGDDGAVHISSPGLYQDYDSWITWFLPENFQGQSYCHLATVNYLKALAVGEMQPGMMMTTADDAPVRPK
ncbi:MAG: hypothetical protein R3F27_01310 [Gammaproteobacteria bacterium]